MTARTRAFRTKHAPDDALQPALPEFEACLENRRAGAGEDTLPLARTVHLPVATVRGAMSSFDEFPVAAGSVNRSDWGRSNRSTKSILAWANGSTPVTGS